MNAPSIDTLFALAHILSERRCERRRMGPSPYDSSADNSRGVHAKSTVAVTDRISGIWNTWWKVGLTRFGYCSLLIRSDAVCVFSH